MPAPATPDEFIELVRKADLVNDKYLDSRLRHIELPDTPHETADLLVLEGILTYYQAIQLLKGRWNCFRIGPYRILERLGFGATSNVYLCEHQGTRARMAVKVLAQMKADDPIASKRFFREARAATLLEHPNLVKVHELDWDGRDNYMVMDFADGSSLQDIVQQFGPMDIHRAAHYIAQAAAGLHFLFQANLVHRDINPGNILVDRRGTIRILDMGLARMAEEESARLTKGEVLGSPEYLAPEQGVDSHNVDTRADIYALGATFYFMLAGEAPYSEERSVARKLLSKASRPPRPLETIRPEVPEDLVAIITKMMAKDPADRYETPRQVADALKPWSSEPNLPPPVEEMPQLSKAALSGQTRLGADMAEDEEPRPRSREWLLVVILYLTLGVSIFAVVWTVLSTHR
jgi:serine/threonine protein kinase